MSGLSRRMFVTGVAAACVPGAALAQSGPPARFSTGELVDSGHKFFGTVSRGLAQAVEEAGRRWGQPNGYVLGQEAGAAFIGGLRYGEGTMYTRNAGDLHLYWEGPSLGFDAGGDGDRTMMLVYNLGSTQGIFRRVGGVDGSAYLVGGFGSTALTDDEIIVVPIRSGLGARLGSRCPISSSRSTRPGTRSERAPGGRLNRTRSILDAEPSRGTVRRDAARRRRART